MNDKLLKRMIFEAIQQTLNEGKSTSTLKEVEAIEKRFKETLCRELSDEHQENKESAQGGSRVGYPRDKGDYEKDREQYERGRGERELDKKYIRLLNKFC